MSSARDDAAVEASARATDRASGGSVRGTDGRRIVVVGGGLAGLAAAIEAVEAAAAAGVAVEVALMEKMPRLGGNSAKASSGINALNPSGGDSHELFKDDTLRSGGGLSDAALVEQLVDLSPDVLKFLGEHGVDLAKVTQLGGHSAPRSFSNVAGPNVGLAIMSALIKVVQDLPSVHVMESAKLVHIQMQGGAVVGVEVVKDGVRVAIPCGAVVLATGGFGANKTLLQMHNPQAASLATTNGEWAQGEGLEVAAAAGASLMHLEHVQIHPTGFVDPRDPSAGTKWLAPEKLRGAGAVLLNADGRRFVDELSTRDVVSQALLKQPGQTAFLVLGHESAVDFGLKTIEFYAAKGMAAHAEDINALAAHMGLDAAALREELRAYDDAAAGRAADAHGKTVFPHGVGADGSFYVASVTPVVHYTMGGVAVDGGARVLSERGAALAGLFGAGEVTGGVHGRNRLGGNSLLECAVYGRIAGRSAVEYVTRLA